MKTFESMTDAVQHFRSNGYTYDFYLKEGKVYCQQLNTAFEPESLTVDESYRFENFSYPGDDEIIYALQTYHGIKGILINAYGVYSEETGRFKVKDEGDMERAEF